MLCIKNIIIQIFSIRNIIIDDFIFVKPAHIVCHLRIKSALFFDDLKFKSALTQNDKKDVI